MEKFDEADTSLDKTASEESIVCKRSFAGFGTIEFADVIRFTGNISDLRGNFLHANGHFVSCDASLDFRVAYGFKMLVIQLVDSIDDGFTVSL